MSELKVHARAWQIEPMVQIEEIRAQFVARLKQALSSQGIDQWGAGARLAKIADVTPKAASKWLNGEALPGPAKMRALADAFSVKIEWLQHGAADSDQPRLPNDLVPARSSADLVSDMLAKYGKNLPEDARKKIAAAVQEATNEVKAGNVIAADFSGLAAKADEILIPQYDVRAAMGAGQVPADYNEAIRNLVVREDLLREKGVSYTSTSALAMVTGWGQSMEGTIEDKDPVIVDRGVTEYIGEGVYLLTWHGELLIKRLQRKDEDHIWLISDNRNYDKQSARLDDVSIKAKVLMVWNARKV